MPDEIMRRYQGDEARSVILKSDQDKGMALVKSKDGRMKWLTVRWVIYNLLHEVSSFHKDLSV